MHRRLEWKRGNEVLVLLVLEWLQFILHLAAAEVKRDGRVKILRFSRRLVWGDSEVAGRQLRLTRLDHHHHHQVRLWWHLLLSLPATINDRASLYQAGRCRAKSTGSVMEKLVMVSPTHNDAWGNPTALSAPEMTIDEPVE